MDMSAPAGPQGLLDVALVALAAVAVVLVAAYAIRLLVAPRERDPEHVKRRVLRDDASPPQQAPGEPPMADGEPAGGIASQDTRVVVYLDEAAEPLLSYRPPVRFELDTSRLDDGKHRLRIEAYDSTGQKGVRVVPFVVRNGPGISVTGLSDDDVLEGKIDVLVNSYGGAGETHWEPSRAETPAPVPTWAWVLFIVIVAFGVFYGVRQWNPPPEFAATPTYGPLPLAAAPASGSAAASRGAANAAGGSAALGASIYADNCAACHQADGKGVPGAFPPLSGNAVVVDRDPTMHIDVVLHGLQGKTIDGTKYDSPMPAWADRLDDGQIAAVIDHERSSWGNDAPKVQASDVAKRRAAK